MRAGAETRIAIDPRIDLEWTAEARDGRVRMSLALSGMYGMNLSLFDTGRLEVDRRVPVAFEIESGDGSLLSGAMRYG